MYFVVMPRVNCIVIFLTYHIYLYSINCPTVICLPNICYLSYRETPLVNCGPGPISIILLSPVYFTRTVYFTRILLLFSTPYAHNLCFKQTGKIDNLIASWEQSTLGLFGNALLCRNTSLRSALSRSRSRDRDEGVIPVRLAPLSGRVGCQPNID
jgi:hypothetical protein